MFKTRICSVLTCTLAFAVAPSCPGLWAAPAEPVSANTLTSAEKATGWKLLFDGQSLAGWRAYQKPGAKVAIGPGWKVEEGILKKLAGVAGGDIITEQMFDDYELSWEWRLAKGANNGVKYFVTEARPQAPGPEYQMIDDADPKWATLHANATTASFYEVLAPASDKPLRPAGEWNRSRIVVRGKKVEHWLNDRMVLAFEMGSAEVQAGIAGSKFKKYADFGRKIRGHIMLTDHHDEAWFRNIKLRELSGR